MISEGVSEVVNGSGGIPRKGREVEYATELWLEGPSAFWLHPEGPLSDTTPNEYREAQAAQREETKRRAPADSMMRYQSMVGLQNAATAGALLQGVNYLGIHQRPNLLGGLFDFRPY